MNKSEIQTQEVIACEIVRKRNNVTEEPYCEICEKTTHTTQ